MKFQKVIAVGSSEIIIIQVGFLRMIRTIIPLQKEQTTAKISCKANPSNSTAYYITNVTGIIVRNSLNTYNMNQQGNTGNSILESTIHHPTSINNNINNINNANNPGNAIPSPNNYGMVSSSPFWFPNLFHNNILNSNDSLSSKTIQSLQESGKVVGIPIKVAKNPIVWRNEQTIKISVFDPNYNQPIAIANVTGSIVFSGLNTGITKDFTIASNNVGTASYSWLIADENAKVGVYKLVIYVSASGYNMTSALTRFTVIPVVSNESNIHPMAII